MIQLIFSVGRTYTVYVQHALIHFQLGQNDKGLALFEALAKKFDQQPDALNCYAQVR